MRLSVGASRGRLIQQLLTESLIIALAGGVAGSLLAWWSFQGLLALAALLAAGQIPALSVDAHPNMTVLWFALALTVATGLVFGLVPALQASKQDVQTVLKQDGAGSGRRTGGWLRGVADRRPGGRVHAAVDLGRPAVARAVRGTDRRAGLRLSRRRGGLIRSSGVGLRRPEGHAFQRQLMERVGCATRRRFSRAGGQDAVEPGPHARRCFAFRVRSSGTKSTSNTVSPEYFSLIANPHRPRAHVHGGGAERRVACR